jgi:hypothetical protein
MKPALALVAADVEGAVVVRQLADAIQGIVLSRTIIRQILVTQIIPVASLAFASVFGNGTLFES